LVDEQSKSCLDIVSRSSACKLNKKKNPERQMEEEDLRSKVGTGGKEKKKTYFRKIEFEMCKQSGRMKKKKKEKKSGHESKSTL
jgi:hypothetical protein